MLKGIKREFKFIEFYIAITNRCNLQCIMCTTGKGKYSQEKELTSQEWENILGNLDSSCYIRRVTFGGGEPLLRQDLISIMKFACACDIETVNIITNGTLLNKGFLREFNRRELDKIGIIVSIDGLRQEHNFIRGKDIFDGVMDIFGFIYRHYYQNHILNDLSVSSILMPENFAGYIEFLEFFRTSYPGIKIDIQPVIPNNEICYLKGKFLLTPQEEESLEKIVSYLKIYPQLSQRPIYIIESYIDYFHNRLAKSDSCLTGTKALNITYEGKPYLCGVELDMPLYKYTFREVYYSEAYQKELLRIEQCHEPCLQGLHINPDNYKDGNN